MSDIIDVIIRLDDGEEVDAEVDLDFTVSPAQRQTFTEPGFPAELYISSITLVNDVEGERITMRWGEDVTLRIVGDVDRIIWDYIKAADDYAEPQDDDREYDGP